MVLVDTSIWVAHLRKGNHLLQQLLMDAEVICHPFIIGELACGSIKNRKEILSLLMSLPSAPVLEFDELMYFIDENRLMGIGIGFVDVHLLASAQLSGTLLWTADKKLNSAADRLSLNYK
jgi:predicted nucleic acid-binding protein